MFSKDSLQRLSQLESLEAEIVPQLTNCQLPSQIYQVLRSHKPLSLILLAARSDKQIRSILWQYIVKLSQTKPILTGNDLKTLGYKPGPLYKEILNDVMAATLDGKIGDRSDAEEYVRENFISG